LLAARLHSVEAAAPTVGGNACRPNIFGIGAELGHHEHRKPSTRVPTEASGWRSTVRRSIARLVPQQIGSDSFTVFRTGPSKSRLAFLSRLCGSTAFYVINDAALDYMPYRGSAPALTDLVGGQVQVMFDPTASSIEHIRAGRLRALAVTTAKRMMVLPDIPTVGDFVPGYARDH
jgi:Tripartite tricarboxylate transporter family receptor